MHDFSPSCHRFENTTRRFRKQHTRKHRVFFCFFFFFPVSAAAVLSSFSFCFSHVVWSSICFLRFCGVWVACLLYIMGKSCTALKGITRAVYMYVCIKAAQRNLSLLLLVPSGFLLLTMYTPTGVLVGALEPASFLVPAFEMCAYFSAIIGNGERRKRSRQNLNCSVTCGLCTPGCQVPIE